MGLNTTSATFGISRNPFRVTKDANRTSNPRVLPWAKIREHLRCLPQLICLRFLHVTQLHALLIVEDNGKGFSLDDETDASAIGLTGIRERASLLAGSMELESEPEKGTTLIVRVPLSVGGKGVTYLTKNE